MNEKHRHRVVLCSHKAVEVAVPCLGLMVRGHLTELTLTHLALASKTGLIAIFPALVLTFTRYSRLLVNRWTSSLILGIFGFVADAMVHPSHYPGAYTEAALTGLCGYAISVAVSYTSLGKRIDQLTEKIFSPRRSTPVVANPS